MQFLKRMDYVFSGIISVLVLAVVALPVIAEDSNRSTEQLTQVTETWGLRLQEKVAAQLQQAVATEIILQYEYQLTQQAAYAMDQVALAVSIDPQPVISIAAGEMLANVVPAANEVECDN